MKKRFTEEQIIGFLREAEAGLAVAELCRRYGFSEASYYLWRSKFGGTSGLLSLELRASTRVWNMFRWSNSPRKWAERRYLPRPMISCKKSFGPIAI